MQRMFDLDEGLDGQRAGFRLQRLELLNWGTFDGLYQMELDGATALLTGENGSGKSTLVDALITLLVPNPKRGYNQAAGNGKRERKEETYVRGAYGRVQSEAEYAARTQYLRDENSYSVLLAHFRNEGYEQDVTLAQVFWVAGGVQKFFVVAERPLCIAEHFAAPASMRELKARLKAMKRVETFDQFTQYSRRFRKIFGLRSDKALDLFNQTVTIKEIGALNEFVRTHMLEETEALDKVKLLQEHYEDLMLAYAALQKAEQQLGLLRPVAEEARRYEQAQAEIAELQGCEEAVPVYFAGRKLKLVREAQDATTRDRESAQRRQTQLQQELAALNEQRDSLKAAMASDETGQRLRELERELLFVQREQQRKTQEAQRYDSLARAFEMPGYASETSFHDARQRAEGMRQTLERQESTLATERDTLLVEVSRLRERHDEQRRELDSLRLRTSQIPEQNVAVRARVLAALGIAEEEAPFVGELLRVREREREWEGAIERLLHHFALCVLVPERHYPRWSRYVNETNLRGRIVFFRVPERGHFRPHPAPDSRDLFHKLQIKPDSAYHEWLEHELRERFSYTCCESLADFERASRAITPQGLIKGGREQHEKDDRRAISDRRFYVLGWSNADKIRAIESEVGEVERTLREQESRLAELNAQQRWLQQQRERLETLLAFTDFAAIDWRAEAARHAALAAEKRRLEESSNRLQQLQREVERVEEQLRGKNREQSQVTGDIARLKLLLEQYQSSIAECQRDLRDADHEAMRRYAPQILERVTQEVTLNNVDTLWREVLRAFREAMEVAERRRSSYTGRLLRAMQAYKSMFAAESMEFDAAAESIPDFDRELTRIERDDLPKHKERFKGMIDEKIIHHISILQADLLSYEEGVKESIANLNHSLRRIPYTPDTYIELKTEPSHDPEIRDFKQVLRDCLADVGRQRDEAAYEQSFAKVQALIQRFKGDQRWTSKVTDVRYWLNFAAVERYRADDSERHYYSDSSGKSGGQKAKLAYTILASAIAFQFGLELGEQRSRSLRFVAVDEAFSRSDENNARYAMQLFRELGLQLLVVTPLTGTHIVEPFIASCHFVWNNSEGNDSHVVTMALPEFRAQRALFWSTSGADTAGD